MKQLIYILSFLVSSSVIGQIDTTVMLISKVDFQPQYELHDGNIIGLMGYSQTIGGALNIPSPTLVFEEGDSVNLSFWNLSQGAPHTIHLHGLDVDQENDGVPSLSFDVVHDDTGSYYFKAPHPGTYLYHCHVTSVLHVQGGMYGLLIVHPKNDQNHTWDNGYYYHSEEAWLMSEIDTNWHHDTIINHPYDPQATMHPILPYNPQHFLINGKSESQLQDYVMSLNEKVYMRLANIGYYGNQVVFPAELNAKVVSSDGRPLPQAVNSDTVNLYPGERFGVLLESNVEFNDTISINYVNLNTQQGESTQQVPVSVQLFVELEENENDILFYPNPATDEVYVSENGEWNLYDVSGKWVTSQTVESGVLNVRMIGKGLYILISPNNKTQKLEIVKH